jgi:hypothetical protein
MHLIWSRHDRLADGQLLLVAVNVERAFAAENNVNLIRFGVRVDTLILPRFEAIQVEKVPLGIENGNLSHFLV